VGVYLVFTSLIVPALATRGLRGATRLAAGYGVGAAGYAIGLALSALLDLPSGAVIVWALAACAVVFARVKGWNGKAAKTDRVTA
jgi:zinc/manganese transport system permease protein